jgi:hypothetical protein
MGNLLHECIQFYQEQGLSIIPIPYRRKAAAIKWLDYQKRQPCKAEIEQWFNNGTRNIAVVTGAISSNLSVLDCDCEEKYIELKETIENKLGVDDLPSHTPVVKTGRGYHVYFRTEELVRSQKLPRLDIKGEGGYVIAPPSIHPNGSEYKFINQNVPSIMLIHSLENISIDLKQEPQDLLHNTQPNWVTEALQGVAEGIRNRTCFKLAGYFKNHLQKDITTQLLINWNNKNQPPLSQQEVVMAVDSAYTYAVNPFVKLNNKRKDFLDQKEISFKSGQVSGQVVDKSREYGELAKPFDEFLKENPEPHPKKEVAELIGTTYKDPAYIKLIQRRAKDGDIKILAGGEKIQWVNKDWQRSRVHPGTKRRRFLCLSLPLGADKYITLPEHSQIVVAGDIGSGKTHWAYAFAELNLGNLPIRHFFNEMGSSKAEMLLDDFPKLQEAFNANSDAYALVNLDIEPLDVGASLDPNGLNIYDWLHLPTSKEWFLLLQRELMTLSQKVDKGVIVVMIQKKRGKSLGYGNEITRMQCELYLTLNIEKDVASHKEGRIDIVKCRDWSSKTNPEVLSCRYCTAPKHGKLVGTSDWFERNSL